MLVVLIYNLEVRMKTINIGDVFENLVIIDEMEKLHHRRRFLCRCNCGKDYVATEQYLLKNINHCCNNGEC